MFLCRRNVSSFDAMFEKCISNPAVAQPVELTLRLASCRVVRPTEMEGSSHGRRRSVDWIQAASRSVSDSPETAEADSGFEKTDPFLCLPFFPAGLSRFGERISGKAATRSASHFLSAEVFEETDPFGLWVV